MLIMRRSVNALIKCCQHSKSTKSTKLQWDILEDVQETLMAPAELQQVLEAESYTTGSLAPFAVDTKKLLRMIVQTSL